MNDGVNIPNGEYGVAPENENRNPIPRAPARSVIDRLLREPEEFLREMFQPGRTGGFLPVLTWRIIFAAAVFGAVMGGFHSVLMAGTSAVKLPLLYVLAVLICLPSFYTSNCLFGSRLSFLQVAAAFACATAVNAVMLAALAPVSLFFLVTSGSYGFHKLLNVFFCAVGGLCGIWYFVRAMRTAAEASGQRLRKGVMFIWLLLYAFVGTQLGWTLRPFFGAPGQPFEFIRKGRISNFYENIIQTISEPDSERNGRDN
ncbi:MAG: hypothetical protein P9M08_01795 [Candidatus Erginobacter occultus]|nr:hypothetical protein [Candidatus Erginobacter occultus]